MSLSVLVVEDDLELSKELFDFLSHAGFAVRCAGSVAEAEAALTEPADMLVLDINLPDGSGLDLCRRLRQTLRSGIIMCTARNERELRISSLKDGADAYLVKPVDPEELEATLISVHRRLRALPAPILGGLRPLLHPWCRRAFKTDQLCALNFDQGLKPPVIGMAVDKCNVFSKFGVSSRLVGIL